MMDFPPDLPRQTQHTIKRPWHIVFAVVVFSLNIALACMGAAILLLAAPSFLQEVAPEQFQKFQILQQHWDIIKIVLIGLFIWHLIKALFVHMVWQGKRIGRILLAIAACLDFLVLSNKASTTGLLLLAEILAIALLFIKPASQWFQQNTPQ